MSGEAIFPRLFPSFFLTLPMTTTFLTRVVRALPLLGLLACSSNQSETADPVAAARDRNEKKIDTADITDRQAADADFLVNATDNVLLGVELGKLAQQKASTAVLRAYGQRLVQQRLELLRALQSLAAAKHLAVPADLGQDARAAYHETSTLTGLQFDKQLLTVAVKMQAQDEDAFDDMQDDAYDGDIRGFAAKYHPALQEQLSAAKVVQDEIDDLP